MAGYTGGAQAPGGPSRSTNNGGAARGPNRVQAPKGPSQNRGPARPGRGTPSRPSGPGKGGNHGGNTGNQATFNYTNPMSDQQINQAAGAIADAQTTGPLDQLARQIARNNAQTSAAEKETAGYYSGLGNTVNQSNQQLAGISSGLNSQLSQIGQDAQQTLAKAYTPGAELAQLNAQGLSGGGIDALRSALANAQGNQAQNTATARSFGATQGAGAQTLGAQNQGTFALKGQESLGQIGRAGQLKDVPLADKMSGLIANRGSLVATALGKLQSTERNYGLARQQLGIKGFEAQTQRQNANTSQQRAITQAQYDNARIRLGQINSALRQQGLTETHRHNLANEQLTNQRIVNQFNHQQTTKGQKPLTTSQRMAAQNELSRDLEHGRGLYAQVGKTVTKGGQSHVVTTQEVTAALQAGGRLTPAEIQAAQELAQQGSVSPGTYAALVKQAGGAQNLPAINRGTRQGQGNQGATSAAPGGAGSTGSRPT